MSVLSGHEDLKYKRIWGVSGGFFLVEVKEGDPLVPYEMYIGPTGGVSGRPVSKEDKEKIDQTSAIEQTTNKIGRHTGVDQSV